MISIESMATTKYATQGGMSARSAPAMLSTALRSRHLRKAQMGKRVEVKPGARYGFLVVIEEAERRLAASGQRCRRVLCQCDCGKHTTVNLNQVMHRSNPSCGCKRGGIIKHGWSLHPLGKSWRALISRCENPCDASYGNYGGRGIDVCDEWHSVDAFVRWGLANGWRSGLFIDRVDNDQGYHPANCRFVTATESQRNTRHNHNLTHDGMTLCLAAWSERTGLPYTTILSRIKLGWTAKDALTVPAGGLRAPCRA